MSESPDRLAALFDAVVDLAPEERSAYLAKACGDDEQLWSRVERLLRNLDRAGNFLSQAEAVRSSGTQPLSRTADKPGDCIGRYKLLDQIGEGGCGVVYMAEQKEPVRRRVALKIIKLGMDTKSVIARFEAERQALALMDHPNIAKVHDAGATQTGRPYFVMELVRGIRITHFCDQKNLSTRERLDLFIQVCRAVQHAHQKGVIHRDLKPSNILVTVNDGVAVPKVIDFGIAKATNQQVLTDKTIFTAFEQFLGTPAYMSPEQAEMTSLDIDTRTDIYSLGVLLYELLTGKTPFDTQELLAAGLDEMRRTIREKEPVRPSTRLNRELTMQQPPSSGQSKIENRKSKIANDLDWITMKCLEKDRQRRYETANALAMDLERHLHNEPVVARPPSRLYSFQKFGRRNKVIVGAAAISAIVLTFGVVISTWQAIRATRAEHATRNAQANEVQQRRRAEAGEKLASQNLYAAQMDLAQQAWEQNNLGRLRQLLQESASYQQRGFEWYYWQRQTRLEVLTLRGHTDVIRSVAFSPDSRRIVTGSWDRTAKVWETATGKELLTLKGHPSGIGSVSFSPNGQRIVTGSDDQSAKVWDATTGVELLSLKGHSGWVRLVAFSPDGQRIVTASDDCTAKVWDATTGVEQLSLRGHSGWVRSVAFSPDGQRIVTGSVDKTAKVWDATTGVELLSLRGHTGEIRSVAFSPNGQQIITGSNDQTAKIWETSGGTELIMLKGGSFPVTSVAFSPDGQRIVTGSEDQTATLWETASGKELLTLKGHSDAIKCVAFSPDGQRIATASDDCTAKVWDARINEPLTLRGHAAAVCALAFSADGRIGTGGKDCVVRLWHGTTGEELLTLKGHRDWVKCLAFSPDGKRIATGSRDKTAKLWDAASGKELLTVTTNASEISSVRFSAENQRLITLNNDETAKLLATLTLKGHSGMLSALALSPDGQRILTGAGDPVARVWDAVSGKELLILNGHSRPIRCGTFSPDGRRIITGSDDQTAKVWDAVSGRELLTLKGHSATIRVVAFSSDGQRIATGSEDQTAKVWTAATPQQVSAWQEEGKWAVDRLAVVRGDRVGVAEQDWASLAEDPAAIKQWLVLAPIAYQGSTGSTALEQEQIPQEANLHPCAGERVKVAGKERVWTEVQLPHYGVDFNKLLGEETEWSVAYAVCYIQSEFARSDVLMRIGTDDQGKVYLNGKEIYRRQESRNYVPDQDVVPGVEFKAGLNLLVFKVVNETLYWKGSIRFTDTSGQQLKGISVTTKRR